jgi:GT2 family glycosyltransferase
VKAPCQVIQIELSQTISGLTLADGYQGVLAVFCWQGIPLGDREFTDAELPVSDSQLLNLALQQITPAVGGQLLAPAFSGQLPVAFPRLFPPHTPNFRALVNLERPLHQLQANLQQAANNVSVIICTRNRSKQLIQCLRSLSKLKPSPQEILVVDNAPNSDATREIVSQFSQVQYILEPRPGLSIARNTGIRHSQGEIIAFTDDDVVVHPGWLAGLQSAFAEAKIMAVTGLMLPAELETEAQVSFHQNSDSRWEYQPLIFDSKFFQVMQPRGVPVWRIGAGANMAFRRQIFQLIGDFDERLGAGAAGCSEDSEIWYRILAEGWQCRYEPTAVVFHYHRSDLNSLQKQMYQYMRGHITALLVQFDRYRHWGNLRRMLIALPKYYFGRTFRKYLKGDRNSHKTLEAEISGCLAGIKYYWQNKDYVTGGKK